MAAGCVLGAAIVAAAAIGLRPDSSDAESAADATTCDEQVELRLAVTASMVDIAEQAAAAVAPDCHQLVVEAASSASVMHSIEFGVDAPDLWIPDSDVWQARLWAEDVGLRPLSPALASSPVLLVGGPSAAPVASWREAIAAQRVALADPLTTGVGALSILAVRSEMTAEGASDNDVREQLVPVAQRYGESRDGRPDKVSLDSLDAGSEELVAATERDYLAALETMPSLEPRLPATGAPLMTYPLFAPEGASESALEAGRALALWFASEEGLAAAQTAGLRDGDGSPIADGVGATTVLTTPTAFGAASDLKTWQVISLPSSVLAVFDASGSMDFDAGGQTRMELAVGVSKTALTVFPDRARIGLWVFSIDQGGPGQDWRRLEPTRRLDAKVRGVTQRDLLNQRSEEMLGLTQGGTGLYDTALAAYEQAVRDYDAAYSNSVILMTDGTNDDPGSLSLPELLEQLRAARDPQRPVRVICIAISEDAGYDALTKIARATGGAAYRARDPRDILEVFAEAIASR